MVKLSGVDEVQDLNDWIEEEAETVGTFQRKQEREHETSLEKSGLRNEIAKVPQTTTTSSK